MSESLSALRRSRKLRRRLEEVGSSSSSDDMHRTSEPLLDFRMKTPQYPSCVRRRLRQRKMTERETKEEDLREGNKLIEDLFKTGGGSSSVVVNRQSESAKTTYTSSSSHYSKDEKKTTGDELGTNNEILKMGSTLSQVEKENLEILELTKLCAETETIDDIKRAKVDEEDPDTDTKYHFTNRFNSDSDYKYINNNCNHGDAANEQEKNLLQRPEESENEYLLRLTKETIDEDSETDEKPERSQKVAKNPLTRQERGLSDFNDAIDQIKSINKVRMSKRGNYNGDIWDDISSDDEICVRLDNSPQERTTKRIKKESKRLLLKAELNKKCDSKRQEESNDEEYSISEHDLKPNIENPKLGPPSSLEPLILQKENHDVIYSVPASINRYLPEYQREGIIFLFRHIIQNRGAILGDDMGTGKTVQIIALLAALLKKTGTGKDFHEIKSRMKSFRNANKDRNDKTFMTNKEGISPFVESSRPYAPVLIIVPPSIVENWSNELEKWGHFSYKTLQREKMDAIKSVQDGITEILVCGKSFFSMDMYESICTIRWKLIIVDEYHEYKNSSTTASSKLSHLRKYSKCPIVGLTGTLMQNKHKELWTLVNIIQPNLLGSWNDFHHNIVKVLKLARTKDAKNDIITLGEKREHELKSVLRRVFLSRLKEEVLKDELTEKTEKVLFCELSNVQKQIYQNILALPDYELLRMSVSPCDCGVNQRYFSEYKRLKSKKEQADYSRKNKQNIVERKHCCYTVPTLSDSSKINPDAVIWRSMHTNDEPCSKCPTCILLPCFQKLYDLCSHPSMLQVVPESRSDEKGCKTKELLKFAKVALTQPILSQLPGKSYYRLGGIMDNHMELSGKMKSLDILLNKYQKRRDKVLIFSNSTVTLDMIQQYSKARGFSHLRLDGQTPTRKRQGLVNQYQNDENLFLFLISTKAGGLGLNITAANKVIIYDVSWNPSADNQAQDRAFRIGQKRDVDVIRLVASGTIEELKYMRQIYKVQQKNQATEFSKNKTSQQRIFRGVEGVKHRKGELFGLENLLQFKDGSYVLDNLCKSRKLDAPNSTIIYERKDVLNAISNIDAERDDEKELVSLEASKNAFVLKECNEYEGSKRIEEKNATTMDHNMLLLGDENEDTKNFTEDESICELGAETQLVLNAYDKFDNVSDSDMSVRNYCMKKQSEPENKLNAFNLNCISRKKKSCHKNSTKSTRSKKKSSPLEQINYLETEQNRQTMHQRDIDSVPNFNFLLMGMPAKNESKLENLGVYIPQYDSSDILS